MREFIGNLYSLAFCLLFIPLPAQGHVACQNWQEIPSLRVLHSLEGLCLLRLVANDDDLVIFHKNLGSRSYRFVLGPSDMALLVDQDGVERLGEEQLRAWLRPLNAELLEVWSQEARHWQEWLRAFDESWFGG